MKTMFIDAEANLDIIPVVKKALKLLPKKVGLVTTLQHLSELKDVAKFLKEKGKKAKIGGQVLGCNVDSAKRIEKDVDCILYIGTGEFHPKALLMNIKKDIFYANPFSLKVVKLDKKEIEKILKKQKGALLKFYSSKEIGVLVSLKPGQERYKDALKLEKKYPQKKFYFLIFNTIDFNELENFPFVECFVNTACPRIGLDESMKLTKAVINIDDVL